MYTSVIIIIDVIINFDMCTMADPGGGEGGASVPPFGLHLTLKSTDDELI